MVGAGPAGCLIAHYLLRRGFSVHLFEKLPAASPPQSGTHFFRFSLNNILGYDLFHTLIG